MYGYDQITEPLPVVEVIIHADRAYKYSEHDRQHQQMKLDIVGLGLGEDPAELSNRLRRSIKSSVFRTLHNFSELKDRIYEEEEEKREAARKKRREEQLAEERRVQQIQNERQVEYWKRTNGEE